MKRRELLQAPRRFRMTVNLGTAKTLDLQIPPALLALADEVIEQLRLGRSGQRIDFTLGTGGTADISGRVASAGHDAIDPTLPIDSEFCRGAQRTVMM